MIPNGEHTAITGTSASSNEDLWEDLETEIAVYAMAFESAAWEIEGDSE